MANKIFNYRYRAQAAAANYGTGNFNVTDVANYGSVSSLVNTTSGSQQRFSYSITLSGNSGIYEYGIGYLTALGGGLYQFTRETSLSSSEGDNSKINILSAYGTVTIDVVMHNPNYSNYQRLSSSTGIANVNSTYFVDAVTDITLSLPAISTDSVLIGVSLTSLSGTEVERTGAVVLDADGTDTIQVTGSSYSISQKNDFIRLMSDPGTSNWVVLDPIAEAGASSGPNGAVQLSKDGVLSYNNNLFFNDDALYIGGDDANTAVIELGVSGTTFNVQSGNIDLTAHGNGVGNTFFVDASANSVGIRTNTPIDALNISTTGVEGITISTTTSGSIPSLTLLNNDPDFTESIDIGRIDFVGTNTADENIVYTRIIAEATDETDGSEEGLYKVLVNNNGSLQIVELLTYEDIQIGPNNSISGGIIIGANNTNQGDNVCIGYYNTNCGVSSISIGNQNTIESGSYAGAIGSDHTVTGSNIWLFGGSGANIAGNNATLLVSNDNNYIQLKHNQHQRVGIYVDSTGTDFNIINTRIASSGDQHLNSVLFRNTSGVLMTGISYGATVLDPAQSAERTEFTVKTLQSGSLVPALSMSADHVNISNLSGIDNSVVIGYGLDVSGTGTSVTIVGLSNTISNNSGLNTIVGYNNELTTSGNDHIVVVGNINTVDDNYSTTVGTSNRNSGLYSSVVGYNNGLYGENIAVIGTNNDVSGNNSSLIGYQNNIDHNSVYVFGQGNTSAYSGVHIFGNDVTATGHNTLYIKKENITITGSSIVFDGARPYVTGDMVVVSGDRIGLFVNDINYVTSGDNISELVNDVNYVTSGDNISELVNDVNYVTSGDNISELVNDVGYLTNEAYVTGVSYTSGISSGILVLSHHSGTVTGILEGVAHSGQNLSIFVNDTSYITSDGTANAKLTFNLSNTGTNSIIFSGAGTQGAGIDETPTLSVYKGFTYIFNCDLTFPFEIQYPFGTTYTSGLTNNVGVSTGLVTWSVRHDSPNTVYYSGSAISGTINVV